VYEFSWHLNGQKSLGPIAIMKDVTSRTSCFRGSDSVDESRRFSTPWEMWVAVKVIDSDSGNLTSAEEWYGKAAKHYEQRCSPTLDGVLGGFANISDIDIEGSRQFVSEIEGTRPSSFQWSLGAAVEFGAGIGRVTKGLLLDLDFCHYDVVESNAQLLAAAPDYIGTRDGAERCRYYCSSLQNWFAPRVGARYSLIWIQWVLCYLTDLDVVTFLQRCAENLIDDGGIIIIKENTCVGDEDDDFVLDSEDSSVTRCVSYLLTLAQCAGLKLVHQKSQDNFPDEIYAVPMLAFERNSGS
jgi:protein N-terminal methyltransferase